MKRGIAVACEVGGVYDLDSFWALDGGKPMPIDVYDMATWMAISVLSEESIVTGQEVLFPDFTNGACRCR